MWWYPDDEGLQTAVRRELATELLYAAPDQNRTADAGGVARVNTYTEKGFSWQINSLDGKYLSMLSRRIETLLEIMGQF